MATEILIERLVMALLLGGIIGLEREYRDKSAGFRTLTLICIGSCLFTLVADLYGGPSFDRITSNIVTGIGFIGAGVIFKSEKGVNGLTTAACIWATAAVGMAIGNGFFTTAGIATFLILFVLFALGRLEYWIDILNIERMYTIVTPRNIPPENYEAKMKECGLRFNLQKTLLKENNIHFLWRTAGSKKRHDKFSQMMLTDDTITGFEF